MLAYLLLKYVHIVGAAVLLGTGGGIAFFMLLAHRTGDTAVIAAVARIVVVADFAFTGERRCSSADHGGVADLVVWVTRFGTAGSCLDPAPISSTGARFGLQWCGCKCACAT